MPFAETMSAIGAGLAGLGTAASSMQVGIGGKKKQKRAFQYNQQLLQQQYDQNAALMKQQQDYALRVWNMENEYNSPVNQMKRFEEAGLNPALMYSRGDSGASGQVGGYDSMPVDYSNFRMSPEDMPMNGLEVAGKVMNGIAQAISTVQDLTSKQEDIESKQIANKIGNADAMYADALAKYRALGLQQGYYLRGGDLTIADSDVFREGLLNRAKDEHFESVVDRMLKQRQIGLADYQKKELKALIANRWRDLKFKNLMYDWQAKEKDMWEQTIYPKRHLKVFQTYTDDLLHSLFGVGSALLGTFGKGKILKGLFGQ